MNSNWIRLVLQEGPAADVSEGGTPGSGPGGDQTGGNGQTVEQGGGNGQAAEQTGGDSQAAGQGGGNGQATGQGGGSGQTTGQGGGNGQTAEQGGGNGQATGQDGGNGQAAGQGGGSGQTTGQDGGNGQAAEQTGGDGQATGQTGGSSQPENNQPAQGTTGKKSTGTKNKTNTGSKKKTTKIEEQENTEKQQTGDQSGGTGEKSGADGAGAGAAFGGDFTSRLGKNGEDLLEDADGQDEIAGELTGGEDLDNAEELTGGEDSDNAEELAGDKSVDKSETGGEGKSDKNDEHDNNTETESGGHIEVPGGGSLLSQIDVGRTAVAAALVLALLAALLCFIRNKKKKAAVSGQAGGTTKKLEVDVPQPAISQAESLEGEAVLPATRETEKAAEGQGRVLAGKVHDIGRRESQQDAFGISDLEDPALTGTKGVFAVVADGMGGLIDSGEVSAQVTLSMIRYFYDMPLNGAPDQELLQMLSLANEEVNRRLGPEGQRKSGSTVVAVWLKGRDMYWIAVGDSHIYLYRNNNLMQVNREHVYGVDLDEKAARGELSFSEAQNDPQRKALTSFVGMGRLAKIDRNIRPLQMTPGDRVVLMSDGVFGVLSDEEMELALSAPIGESASILDQMVRSKNVKNQDNYTAVILEYR